MARLYAWCVPDEAIWGPRDRWRVAFERWAALSWAFAAAFRRLGEQAARTSADINAIAQQWHDR